MVLTTTQATMIAKITMCSTISGLRIPFTTSQAKSQMPVTTTTFRAITASLKVTGTTTRASDPRITGIITVSPNSTGTTTGTVTHLHFLEDVTQVSILTSTIAIMETSSKEASAASVVATAQDSDQALVVDAAQASDQASVVASEDAALTL